MSQQDTQSLWEYLEYKYHYGEYDSPSFATKVKAWLMATLLLGFFFVFIPFALTPPIAQAFGMQDWFGIVLITLEVIIYLAGKSIRIRKSS